MKKKMRNVSWDGSWGTQEYIYLTYIKNKLDNTKSLAHSKDNYDISLLLDASKEYWEAILTKVAK